MVLEGADSNANMVVVLMDGYQHFGNGINLNTIDNASNPELCCMYLLN